MGNLDGFLPLVLGANCFSGVTADLYSHLNERTGVDEVVQMPRAVQNASCKS